MSNSLFMVRTITVSRAGNDNIRINLQLEAGAIFRFELPRASLAMQLLGGLLVVLRPELAALKVDATPSPRSSADAAPSLRASGECETAERGEGAASTGVAFTGDAS